MQATLLPDGDTKLPHPALLLLLLLIIRSQNLIHSRLPVFLEEWNERNSELVEFGFEFGNQIFELLDQVAFFFLNLVISSMDSGAFTDKRPQCHWMRDAWQVCVSSSQRKLMARIALAGIH